MFYNNIVEIWGILNNQNLFENLRPIYEPYWFFCIIYKHFYDGKNENFRFFFQTNEQKKTTTKNCA